MKPYTHVYLVMSLVFGVAILPIPTQAEVERWIIGGGYYGAKASPRISLKSDNASIDMTELTMEMDAAVSLNLTYLIQSKLNEGGGLRLDYQRLPFQLNASGVSSVRDWRNHDTTFTTAAEFSGSMDVLDISYYAYYERVFLSIGFRYGAIDALALKRNAYEDPYLFEKNTYKGYGMGVGFAYTQPLGIRGVSAYASTSGHFLAGSDMPNIWSVSVEPGLQLSAVVGEKIALGLRAGYRYQALISYDDSFGEDSSNYSLSLHGVSIAGFMSF